METTEQELDMRVISLRDLWEVFKRRFILMLLAAVVVAGGAFAYKQLTFVPRYESTATLYLVNQSAEDSESSSTTYNNFSLALKLVNDCNHLIKSHSVLDQVISGLHLSMDYEDLYEAVSVSNPEDTRILEVTVEAETPEQAKNIVDEICVVGTQKIEEAMGFEQAKLYEYGVLNEEPCNTTNITTFLLLGLLAAVCVYAIFLVRFLLDDRIRTDEDIERTLGLSILGDIPNADNPKKGRGYGKYGKGYYGKKGYGNTPYGQAAVNAANAAQPKGSLPGLRPAGNARPEARTSQALGRASGERQAARAARTRDAEAARQAVAPESADPAQRKPWRERGNNDPRSASGRGDSLRPGERGQ